MYRLEGSIDLNTYFFFNHEFKHTGCIFVYAVQKCCFWLHFTFSSLSSPLISNACSKGVIFEIFYRTVFRYLSPFEIKIHSSFFLNQFELIVHAILSKIRRVNSFTTKSLRKCFWGKILICAVTIWLFLRFMHLSVKNLLFFILVLLIDWKIFL